MNFNLELQRDQEYAIDIEEDLDYFPVIQGDFANCSASLIKSPKIIYPSLPAPQITFRLQTPYE